MSIFEPSTPVDESPEIGHEEETAEAFESEQHEEVTEETTTEHQEYEEEAEVEPSQEEHGDLLAGKYKSVDDLVAGYKNLERQFHQSRQQPQTQTQVPQDQNIDYNEVFWEQFRDNPLNTMQHLIDAAVNQRTAPIYEQRQTEVLSRNIQDVAKEYGQLNSEEGLSQLFERVQDISQELGNPQLASNPTQRVLKMAAQELFGESKAQLYQKAKQAGRAEAEASRKSKQGLSGPTGAKKTEQPKTQEELIRESIVNAGRRSGLFG